MELKNVLHWFDIPRTEAPTTARMWIEGNFDPAQASSGFGLTGTSCSADIPDPTLSPHFNTAFSYRQTLDLILQRIDDCELFLVHDLASKPIIPLARLDPETNRYLVSETSLSPVARENADQALKQAERNHGSLAPPPSLANSEAAGEPTKSEPQKKRGGIALLPVRYAIGRNEYGDGDGGYGYTGENLKHDFPQLKNAHYVLRTLRAGFVYVYFDDTLECFSAATTRLKPHPERNSGTIRATGDALIIPGDGKGREVLMAFSEHEWTENQCNSIIDNVDNCRDRQMQRFSLESPEADACPLSELASEVQEYAGFAPKFNWWSDYPSHGRYLADRRLSKLRSMAGSQYIIALHDPIGITHDLASLIDEQLKDLQGYTQDNLRKKVIAETIERLYIGSYLRDTFENVEDLARTRQAWYETNYPKLGREIPSLDQIKEEVRADALDSRQADDLKEHVREDDRKAFLKEYRERIASLQEMLQTHRNDRAAWLQSATTTDSPSALGAAWSTYDLNDDRNWTEYQFSFARAIAGMGTGIAESDEDQEFALLGDWLDSPGSWIYKAIANDKLLDAITSNWGLLGTLSDGSAKVIWEIHKDSPFNKATLEIERAITTYAVSVGQKGSTAGGLIQRLEKQFRGDLRKLGGQQPDELAKAVQAIAARRGLFAELVYESKENILLTFEKGSPHNGIVNEYRRLPKQKGSLQDGVAQFELTEVKEGKLGNAKPLGGWGNAGVAGGVFIFSAISFKAAVDAIADDINSANDVKGENIAGIVSSAFGVLGAMGGGLNALEDVSSAAYGRVVVTPYVGRVASTLSSQATARFLGYWSTFAAAATDGFKAHSQFSQGEFDAGLLYSLALVATAGSGVSMTFGTAMILGSEAMVANPFVGTVVIIIGLALAGLAAIFEYGASNSVAGPIERWLDSSSFGWRNMDDPLTFESLKDEQEGLVKLVHEPVVLGANFDVRPGWPHYLAEYRLYLPNYTGESEFEVKNEKGVSVYPAEREHTPGGLLLSYSNYVDKQGHEEWSIRYTVEYSPSPSFQGGTIVKSFIVDHLLHDRPDEDDLSGNAD